MSKAMIPMKSLLNILSALISETFEKADPSTWNDTTAYRPGPVMIPVDDLKGKPTGPRFLPPSGKK
jgi:hypothetical protein